MYPGAEGSNRPGLQGLQAGHGVCARDGRHEVPDNAEHDDVELADRRVSVAEPGGQMDRDGRGDAMRLVEGGLRGAGGRSAGRTEEMAVPIGTDDGVQSWALQLLLDEVKRSSVELDPNRAELLLQKIEARQRQTQAQAQRWGGSARGLRLRGWLTRVMHMLVFWAAAVAGSRAFRMLTL
jgi:hypothetical protein